MRRTLLVPIVGAAILVGGCSSSSSSSSSSASAPSASGAQTRTVKVDNSTSQFVGGFLAYFPNQVTVHPGDTVDFTETFSGEPHSVTLGTLVEKGLAAAKTADPNGPPPADLAALPTMLPQGPGDADQRAVNPCFVDSGAIPSDGTAKCATTTQPAFTGTQAYYNSGFLNKGSHFAVKLAADVAPGTYHYYCNLHGPDMSGTITVAPASTPIPAQSDVDAAGKAQLDAIVTKLAPAAQAASTGQANLPGAAANLAGFGSQAVTNAQIEQFYPATISAKVGEKVSWTFIGVHTITFGAATPPPFVITQAPDGAYHLDPHAAAPVPPPSGAPPASSGSAPTTVDGGTYSGTGLHSSGIHQSFPPALVTYDLTFSKAGTYNYVCLIHPGMIGQVVVK